MSPHAVRTQICPSHTSCPAGSGPACGSAFHYLSLLRSSPTSREARTSVGRLHGTRFSATRFLDVKAAVSGPDLPVGVFEADASLLQLIGILQLGHILGVDGGFRHGFLEKQTRRQLQEGRMLPQAEVHQQRLISTRRASLQVAPVLLL